MTALTIAGGVYREICQFPDRREILGSGGRAAAALSGTADTELHTFVAVSSMPDVELALAPYNVELFTYESADLISFKWMYGLASPQQTPLLGKADRLRTMDVQGEVVLRYGMVEGDAKVDAEIAVFDPQAPLHAERFSENGSKAQRLAYVVNLNEARLITLKDEPSEQLKVLHHEEGAEVVVLKQGPHGALVSDGRRTEWVPCFKTDKVWSIGSGDVFSAVFAYGWGVAGMSAHEAAHCASLATAHYCNAGYLPVPLDSLSEQFEPCMPTFRRGERRCVYLAGPFFHVAQRWLIDNLRDTLHSLGVDVFSPIHDVGFGVPGEVAAADLRGLERSHVLLAVCDGLDSGTMFEVGYAAAKGIPVIAFSQNETSENLLMLRGSGCAVEDDLDTAIYKAVWAAIER